MVLIKKTCAACYRKYECDGSCKSPDRTGIGRIDDGGIIACCCPECLREHVFIEKRQWEEYMKERASCTMITKDDWEEIEKRLRIHWMIGDKHDD